MLSKIQSLGCRGVTGYAVSVECHVSNGLPGFDIVGLPDAAVKEARERVRSAITTNGMKFPVSRLTVNLAPADTRKAGTLYDLPVLLGTFAMGPVPGTLILLVKSLLGLLHSSSQGVGELADFLMGFAMLLPAGLIYQHNKTRKGALIGMAVGTVVATIVAVLSNLYIMIPFYGTAYGMPVEAIVGMGTAIIPAVDSTLKFVLLITAPFNLLKWVLISALTGLMYKPLSPILHGRNSGGKSVTA